MIFEKVRRNLSLLTGQRLILRQETEIGGIMAPLKAGGFADVSIVGYINEINAMGYKTVASCSGMRRDHHGHEESPYLSIELPEDVVTPSFGRTAHEVFPSQIKNRAYVDSLIRAGELANWASELSLYLLFIPTVHYDLPKTGSIENDRRAESEPDVIQAQRELDEVMGRGHTTEEFMEKLNKRDRIREAAYQKYGGRKSWSDEEMDQMWRNLVTSIRLHGPLSQASAILPEKPLYWAVLIDGSSHRYYSREQAINEYHIAKRDYPKANVRIYEYVQGLHGIEYYPITPSESSNLKYRCKLCGETVEYRPEHLMQKHPEIKFPQMLVTLLEYFEPIIPSKGCVKWAEP